jgi:hypothetical protein
MQHLLGSTPTLLVAALLLVVVTSLPSLPALAGARARWRVPCLVGVGLAAIFLVGLGLRHSPALPDMLVYRVVRYAAAELEQATEPNVIVIDGGSYVLNGVDTELLEMALKEHGYRVRAIRIATGAANHFERYDMQRRALSRAKREPEPNQRWVYMTEVQKGYDAQPLAQFERNQDTFRTYTYLSPDNAWFAAKAMSLPDSEVPFEGAWRWPLFRHALVNASSAGALQRLVPEETIGFHTGVVSDPPRRARFKFRGMSKVLKAARQKRPRAVVPSWLAKVREPRSLRLWRPRLDELVYFGIPTTEPEQLEYVRAFCRSTRRRCLAPTDKALLEALDKRSAWRNATHLSRAGATVYTRWLAAGLAETGVLQK